MNNLTIKRVNFDCDELVAVKNEMTGKIYIGVSYICKGIGFRKSQKDTQVQNVQNDFVLNKGCLKFQAGVLDPDNEAVGIELDFLPLWLAKITITPKMQEEQPDITEKLIHYQLKSKDVLAAAFLNKPQCLEDVLIQSLQEMKGMRQQLNQVTHNALAAKNEAIEAKEEVQAIREVVEIMPSKTWRNETNSLIKKICYKLGDYSRPKEDVYKALQERGGCDLKRRMENMRARLLLNGGSKSKADALNYLDVIAEDKKLIEIYTAIVKEMAIRNKVA